MRRYLFWEYDHPLLSRPIRTRELPPERTLDIQELLSHETNKIDNTGNIRVWPAEEVLLLFLLTEFSAPNLLASFISPSPPVVLEIGGGMTGLAGIGISTQCERVVVTDGHPGCVKNMRACVAMGERETVIGRELRWDDFSNEQWLFEGEGFNLLIASDCLFFEDFHSSLIGLLEVLLSPTCVGVFVQPSRGNSFSNFVDLLDGHPSLSYEIHEQFNQQVIGCSFV